MTASSKPAERLALASLILSIVFFVITFLIGRWSNFFAVSAIGWMLGAPVLIWLVLVIQFHTRSLAEQEKLDMGQLVKAKESATIFHAKGRGAELFAVAQRRLQLLEKWFLPGFSVIIAAYQIGIGWYLLKALRVEAVYEPKQPLLCAVLMVVVAFTSFLISRYATGMSASSDAPGWKPLRAGGGFLAGIAVLCFVLAVALALVQFEIFVVLNVINWVVPILLIVLGAETALNIIFDIYRPRVKGAYGRSAFDSRLLGIINEPGGILHTAASAVDYQFGFKVSQTWFYKLLEKAILPLILFAAVTLYSLSCIVVVNPDEEAIIEYFGNPLDKGGDVRLAGPGLAFKLPWPFGIAYKHPTKTVSQLNIGFVPEIDPETKEIKREPRLWGKTHYAEEYPLLVASEQDGSVSEGATPVSIVMAAVPVQYRVKDLFSFMYNHSNSAEMLEFICYRELTRFAASATIEVDDQAGKENSLLGAGRTKAKKILTERIQKAADDFGLGVEIVFVGLQGIHPPVEVAADYQKVTGAVQQKQKLIFDAEAMSNRILSFLAGSVEEAEGLYALAAEYQKAKDRGDSGKIRLFSKQLDLAFAAAQGDIFKRLTEAQSYAFEKATLARATGRRFAGQLQAYRAAPQIYKHNQHRAALEQALDNTRKYVVVADVNDHQVFRIDLTEKLTPGLYDLTGLEENNKK